MSEEYKEDSLDGQKLVTDIHRFKCKDGHVFFIPLELPMDVTEFANMCLEMQCPRCGLRSKSISVDAENYIAIRMQGRQQ